MVACPWTSLEESLPTPSHNPWRRQLIKHLFMSRALTMKHWSLKWPYTISNFNDLTTTTTEKCKRNHFKKRITHGKFFKTQTITSKLSDATEGIQASRSKLLTLLGTKLSFSTRQRQLSSACSSSQTRQRIRPHQHWVFNQSGAISIAIDCTSVWKDMNYLQRQEQQIRRTQRSLHIQHRTHQWTAQRIQSRSPSTEQ